MIIGLVLVLGTLSLSAQTKNKKYDLFYLQQNQIYGPIAFPTGTFMRNDSLFIEVNALVNVIVIHNEDSTWKSLLLKPFREKGPDKGEGPLKRVTIKPSGEIKQEIIKEPKINTQDHNGKAPTVQNTEYKTNFI